MNEFNKLYEFITLAEKNRKYPVNTAHGRRAALKLFETVLHPDELESLDLIKERMKEIYLSLISTHKNNFSVKSLNTYRGRFLNVIQDYRKYGSNPEAIVTWDIKPRKYKNKDVSLGGEKDSHLSISSLPIHKHVYKIQISLRDGSTCAIELPAKIAKEDVAIITKIIGSLLE